MKKIYVFLGIILSFLVLDSTTSHAAYGPNRKLDDEDYVYFSDDLLRQTVGSELLGNLYSRTSPLTNVFQVKQLKQYPSNEFSFELGRSIEGVQNLPETVTHFEGGESEIKDITPLFEMQQLTDIRLVTAFVDDNDQLQQLINLENLRELTVVDSNEAFKSFDVEIPTTLKQLNYTVVMDIPTLLIEKGQKFQMANPIELKKYESNTGSITFAGGKGFTFENNILTWENSDDVPNFLRWEYKDISNNRNIKISGSVNFSKLIIE